MGRGEKAEQRTGAEGDEGTADKNVRAGSTVATGGSGEERSKRSSKMTSFLIQRDQSTAEGCQPGIALCSSAQEEEETEGASKKATMIRERERESRR
jgi:hypothetical protein